MLATRDKNGNLIIYNTLTKEFIDKYEREGIWSTILHKGEFMKISKKLLPNVKWEDKEPTEVEITIKVK